MNKVISYVKAHWRAILFALLLILSAYFAVMGWWYTDVAKKQFWWTFWDVIKYLCLVLFGFAIYWFGKQKGKSW